MNKIMKLLLVLFICLGIAIPAASYAGRMDLKGKKIGVGLPASGAQGGALLILNAVGPLLDRVAEISPEVAFPDDNSHVGAFLSDFILHGIAAPQTGETT